jgi:hypothetical protein
MAKKQFLLVEPVAKTPYPPLGLMKISSMLKDQYKECQVHTQLGNGIPSNLLSPEVVYITSLFTWDIGKVINSINYYKRKFPSSTIAVGGISASLMPDMIYNETGVKPHIGLLNDAEKYSPDYSLDFGRKIRTSISFTTRGCIRNCNFCNVKKLEPEFFVKNDWERDISADLPMITFWDNNFLASPNFQKDCETLIKLNKKVDFNQGLDARLYTEDRAKLLSKINVDPIRFAFDDIHYEQSILKAIRIAKKYTQKEICVYVLYNFEDTPEDFYYRINLLNKEKVLAFPMGYRDNNAFIKTYPNKYWNSYLLRALKLSLLFYYRKGMITEKRESFESIYGKTEQEFVSKLYDIYNYDKSLVKKK